MSSAGISSLSIRTPRSVVARARRAGWALAWVALALLAGCASPVRVDSQVESFSSLAGVPTGGYRFERMPLQQADPGQPRVEALAQAALGRAGLARNDAAPALSIQAWARIQRLASPYDPWGPGPGWGPGWGTISGGFGGHRQLGVGIGVGIPLGGPERYGWRREAGLVMRDLATGQVVYQTQAVQEGPWLDADRTLGLMFDAALQGFPQPPAGPRRVNITLSR
jgi:hypothetical protein